MKFIADYYKPDLVLMPIGGHFTMDPVDAALPRANGSAEVRDPDALRRQSDGQGDRRRNSRRALGSTGTRVLASAGRPGHLRPLSDISARQDRGDSAGLDVEASNLTNI